MPTIHSHDGSVPQKKSREKGGLTSCTNLRRSGGMCGNTCVLRSEHATKLDPKIRHEFILPQKWTHSAKAFSTTPTNLGPNVRAHPTSSLDQLTRPPFASRVSSRIPNASASRAFRFLISHSPVHVNASFVPEHGTVERRFPHGHVSVTGERQGSVSGQAAGAWQVCVHGWRAGRLSS